MAKRVFIMNRREILSDTFGPVVCCYGSAYLHKCAPHDSIAQRRLLAHLVLHLWIIWRYTFAAWYLQHPKFFKHQIRDSVNSIHIVALEYFRRKLKSLNTFCTAFMTGRRRLLSFQPRENWNQRSTFARSDWLHPHICTFTFAFVRSTLQNSLKFWKTVFRINDKVANALTSMFRIKMFSNQKTSLADVQLLSSFSSSSSPDNNN